MEEEYLILECPACERSVKFKSSAAGTRMGCPYCKEPIDVTSEEGEVPLGEDDVEEKVPLDFRRIQTMQAATTMEAASAENTSEIGAAPQGERRKRKRQSDAPDWDSIESAEADKNKDETEIDDDSSEFLEMDPDSPGDVRLKRVRRKKILTKKDKFIRGAVVAGFAVALGIAGLIAYSAFSGAVKVITTEGHTRRELPKEILVLINKAKETPITPELTQAEEIIAAKVLRGFLNSTNIDERLQYVRDQERVKPLMEDWYTKNPEEATRDWPDAEILLRKKIIDKDRYFVVLAVEFLEIGKRVMAIEQNAETGEMRLDWETTVAYQPMPLEEFKSLKPRVPVKFWVKVKPSDFYNHSFSDPLKYQAVELSYPGREFKLIGYVDRTKEWAPSLIAMLESGTAPSLIVNLKYPEGDIKDTSQVEIDSIIADSWWQ